MRDDVPLQIGPAEPQTALKSLELIFGDVREVDRHLQVHSLLVEELPREGLFEARRGGRVVGAVLAITQPGKIGLVWPPRLVEGEPADTADRLMEAADGQLAAAGVSMAYAALASVGQSDDRLLWAHGYDPLSSVLYLAADEQTFPAARPESPLDFEPYAEANHARLAKIVEATHDESQDCPRLAGVRNVEDVLAGYRATGEFDPAHWLLVRHRGEDVGCLIVTDHPEHGCCELVYMGLALPARGRGWGKHIARHAQWLAARAGRGQLVVAVDAANDPAIAVYAAVGFRGWDRRVVYVKKGQKLEGRS